MANLGLPGDKRFLNWNDIMYEQAHEGKTVEMVDGTQRQTFLVDMIQAKRAKKAFIAGGKQVLTIQADGSLLISTTNLKDSDIKVKMARHETKSYQHSGMADRVDLLHFGDLKGFMNHIGQGKSDQDLALIATQAKRWLSADDLIQLGLVAQGVNDQVQLRS